MEEHIPGCHLLSKQPLGKPIDADWLMDVEGVIAHGSAGGRIRDGGCEPCSQLLSVAPELCRELWVCSRDPPC